MSQRLQESQCYGHDGGIPALVITQTEEVSSDLVECISENMTPTKSSRTACLSDGTELNGNDLQLLKSDTISLISEEAISSKSNEGPEEDAQSVTASSVLSLFHRIQMDPVEREWLWCAALGNASALYVLLEQDPTLVSKKTALHWAAKQGRVEIADMMAGSGADVNQRAGYTALHLASLHGHDQIIRHLINNYNAKVNIRDYHGKIAAHYWNGSMDIFNKLTSHSAGRWSRGRRTQCYAQLSTLLSYSQTHGKINVEVRAGPLEPATLNRSPSS
ncbi:ankyrin repeat domain-containing protein SOWAHB [Xyrauchen texanus]|uniref:ankyrin repeat domain-containing protein SOWAHB n=1 Tax=Xyrauchen texanus TaxID=154827 RepID=UPI00224241C2|nr:ankyrin repeat domain-containing protein SOWAHB [Xyrauchen texanus]XP_051978437.1 ankyrin repeat domain-containing protein SOWAHB [Xyrauchen texanus]